jgi:hypothetical protein
MMVSNLLKNLGCTTPRKDLPVPTGQEVGWSPLPVLMWLSKYRNTNRNTRQGCNFNLYQPSAHRSLYLKAAYYMGIRVFNNHPVLIKQLYNNPIDFKLAVKGFLGNHLFYTLDEYFDCRFDKNNDIIQLQMSFLNVMLFVMFYMF